MCASARPIEGKREESSRERETKKEEKRKKRKEKEEGGEATSFSPPKSDFVANA